MFSWMSLTNHGSLFSTFDLFLLTSGQQLPLDRKNRREDDPTNMRAQVSVSRKR